MRAALALPALLLAGCTLALDYPSGPELCGNGIDDDGDGHFDCEQTCIGICPEDVEGKCQNAVDDDGDGLMDWADPGCWPLADVTLSSCASVPATTALFDFDVDHEDEAWAATAGTLAPDPTGRFPGLVFVAPPTLEDASATEIHDLVGRVAGTTIRAEVYLDVAHAMVSLTALVQDAPLGVNRVVVTVSDGVLNLEALTIDHVELTGAGPGWYELLLTFESRTQLSATLSRAGVLVGGLTVGLADDALGATHALSVRLAADPRASMEPVVVGEVEVVRPPHRPCDGREVPRAGSPSRALSVRGWLTLDDGARCAVGNSFLDSSGDFAFTAFPPALARTDDRGLEWTTSVHDDLARPGLTPTGRRFLGGSVIAGRYHTLLWDASMPSQLASTDDCAAIALEGNVPRAADRDARGYGFDGTVHEIVAAVPDQLVLRRFGPDATTFETTTLVRGVAMDQVVHVARLGNDYLVTLSGLHPAVAVVSTLATRGVTLRNVLEIEGSSLSGACDEFRALDPLMAMDAVPVVDGAGATGLVLVSCTGRDTYVSGLSGIIADEVIIRGRP